MARPRGSLNHSGLDKRLLQEAKSKSPIILASTIEEAIQGNIQAQKLILDKVIPNLKPEAKPISFELSGDSMHEQASSILKACAKGDINHDIASSLISSLSGILKIKEFEEFERRLIELEARLSGAIDEN